MANPTIAYIALSEIPSQTANSIQVVRMCSAFRRVGHDVTLLAPAQVPVVPVADIFAHYGVSPEVRIQRYVLPRIRGATHVFAARAGRSARNRADLTYTRSVEGAFYSTLLGQPTLFEAHLPAEAFRPLQRRMLSFVLRSPHLRRVIIISNALLAGYARSAPGVSIVVAPDGTDVGHADHPVDNGNRLRVGYAGSLYKGRGVEMLIELARRSEWADFHVYGGPESALAPWQAHAGTLANITFHGQLPPNRVPSALKDCDVLLAPYERAVYTATDRIDTSRWMSPLKLFEYMAARRPVICSDLPALREVVSDGSTALLCDPDDPGSWAEALVRLRDDPALRISLANQAFSLVARRYTWDVRARAVTQDLQV